MDIKAWVRWVTIGALFIIPFLPLVAPPLTNNLFFPFITGKNFAFRIIVEVAVAGWALLALVDARYRPRFSWTLVLFTAFVVWMAIADAFAINPAKAFWSNFERMDGWVTLIHVYGLFIVATCVLSVEKLWRKWWYTFLIGAACICAYSVGQLLHVIQIHQGGVRLDATFGNAEYLAAYLLFSIAVSLWLALESKTKWLRWVLGIFIVLQTFILLESETRGAIIGAFGAVVLGGLLWAFESGKRGRRLALGAIAIVLVLALGTYLARDSAFIQHIPGLDRVASISLKDPETTARLKIWHMAIEGFQARPITGYGQEGFNYVFNKYYDPSLYAQEQWFDRAHDIYLDWLTAGGAPALLLFLAFIISTVVALYRSKATRTERIMLISVLAAYLFQGIFVFDNLFTYVPLAIILAMASDVSSCPIKRLEGWKEMTESTFTILAVPIGVIALLIVMWFVNVPNVKAAEDLIGAITPSADATSNIAQFKTTYGDGSFANQEITEQLISYAEGVIGSQSVSNADKVTVVTYALQQAQALTTKIPNDARIRIEYAMLLRAAGEYTDAPAQIHVAEQLSPSKQTIIEEEGVEDWDAGNNAAASAAFIKAYHLDPENTSAAMYAAGGVITQGSVTEGKQFLQQVFGTSTIDSDVLVVAYYQAKDFPDLIAVLQKRVADQSGAPTAEFQLAEAYVDSGNIAAGKAVIQATIAAHPEVASEGEAILAQIPQSGSATVAK